MDITLSNPDGLRHFSLEAYPEIGVFFPLIDVLRECRRAFIEDVGSKPTVIYIAEGDARKASQSNDILNMEVFPNREHFLPCGLPPYLFGMFVQVVKHTHPEKHIYFEYSKSGFKRQSQ